MSPSPPPKNAHNIAEKERNMSPSTAIAYQYSNAPNAPSSSSSGGGGGGGGGGGFASEWNNMDSGGLDFDLLAEYLLEDINAGGFDFG